MTQLMPGIIQRILMGRPQLLFYDRIGNIIQEGTGMNVDKIYWTGYGKNIAYRKAFE